MKNKIYYVVEKQTETYGETEECTGIKHVQAYEIVDGEPKEFFDMEVSNEDSSIEAMKYYLINNGLGDKEFEFVQL